LLDLLLFFLISEHNSFRNSSSLLTPILKCKIILAFSLLGLSKLIIEIRFVIFNLLETFIPIGLSKPLKNSTWASVTLFVRSPINIS